MAMPPPTKKTKIATSRPPRSKQSDNSNSAQLRRNSSVSKAKSTAKKESPTQANTLFDFYPNLSKNAPLFRATMSGEDSTTPAREVPTPEVKNMPVHESIMHPIGSPPPSARSPMTSPQQLSSLTCRNPGNNAFGPFSLDDDDECPESLTIASVTAESHHGATNCPESSIAVGDGITYANALGEQVETYRDIGEEIELNEERDRFENGDEEVNEDEEWSWQEYHAENFGQHESRDQAVLCPICGRSIITMSEHDRSAHVNKCLDLPAPPEEENQIRGEPLIDATVAREMNRQDHVHVKAEPGSPPVVVFKAEEVLSALPLIKAEDDEIEEFVADVKDEFVDVKEEASKKEEKEDMKPHLLRGSSNAFDKIMVNHTEEKQWADAAKTENAQRGTKYKTRVCPFYKILSPFPIAVDAFKYGTVPGVQGYYLTHFHSDHYGGLSSTWDAGPIFCSSITGNLVVQQLKVRPEYVVKLPMNVSNDINGVKVTLIDANHCPGSTLFLFEGQARGRELRYLHCGDFRATPTQLLHPSVRGKKIDSLYLDTTYLSPKYAFPSQEDVIEACSHVCRDLAGLLPEGQHNPVAEARNSSGMAKFLNQKSKDSIRVEEDISLNADPTATKTPRSKGRLLVVVGTYSIGKERIVLGIAKALNSKIFAAQRKRDILSCLEDPELESRITSDPLDAQVHMTYLQEIRAETLCDYLTQFHPHFQRIVGFRGTGWTYTPPKTRFLDNPTVEQIMSWNPRYTFHNMNPGRGSNSTAACYGVPYSEHSSFRELMCFCLSANLGRVIPTVNVGSEKSRRLMKAWIDKWALEVRKVGLRKLEAGQTEWR